MTGQRSDTLAPVQPLEKSSLGKLKCWISACLLLALFAATAVALQAEDKFVTLASFNGANGKDPFHAPLVQGTNGQLYGTTNEGGAYGYGSVFEATAEGKLTTLYSFCSSADCTDGQFPTAGLVQGTDGDFYGTTAGAGSSGNVAGTVFKITPQGKLTTLYNFCSQANCTDGTTPWGGVVQATNGDFYGTTLAGGTGTCGASGCGTVFKITAGGKLTTMHSFDATDGSAPYDTLVQGFDGNFYGTTQTGGAYTYGTVFEITAKGKLTTLYSFCSQANCADGAYPTIGLMQATNGNFYGDTPAGGTYGYGTVFEITAKGKLTTLYSFCSQGECTQDIYPELLMQATNGNFYGTTTLGGTYTYGTVFEITAKGKLTTLYSFCSQANCADGAYPGSALVQVTNGKLYGSAQTGGRYGVGTLFSLAVGLGPFVEALPNSGKVGTSVKILGTNLSGATGVAFNGTTATFTVVSKSEIKTTVPVGATTGLVEVTTPEKTLKSNVDFRVP